MLDKYSLAFCAAKSCSIPMYFACLSELLNHAKLDDEEKLLGCWLAIQCVNKASLTCLLNYEQISQAVQKPSSKVHRILTRLRTMGFFISNIDIYYGEPTPEMNKREYSFELIVPMLLPYSEHRAPISLNLMKEKKQS